MISALFEIISVVLVFIRKTGFNRIIEGYMYTISIFDSDLVWRIQLIIIKG